MVRLEDVGAMVSVQAMKTLSDYLATKTVPFSIAVIPRYVDPLGRTTTASRRTCRSSQATNLRPR
jgi:uncharacterized protein YdaL